MLIKRLIMVLAVLLVYCIHSAFIIHSLPRSEKCDFFQTGMEIGQKGKFAVCAIGIFVCYFYYGILQERM